MGVADFFKATKLRNVFGGDNTPQFKNVFQESPPSSVRTPVPQMDEEMEEPSSLDMFRQSILNPPERDRLGSKTNIMRMIGTGLLSALQGDKLGSKPFNIEQTQAIMNSPYEQKLEDWKLRTEGLEGAAKMEAAQIGKEELAALRRSQIPREERLSREGDIRLEQAQQRIDILRDKEAKNTLTDRERIELQGYIRSGLIDQQGNIRSRQIEQQGDIRSRQIGEQGDIRSGQIEQQGEESRKTKQVVPGKNLGQTGEGESATQTRMRLQLRANEAIQDHPEWAEFLKINPDTGMVDITPPSTSWFGGQSGPDKQTYDAMVRHMKGGPKTSIGETPVPPNKVPPKSAPTTTTKVQPNSSNILTKTQRNPKTGETRIVTSNDGGKTWSVKK